MLSVKNLTCIRGSRLLLKGMTFHLKPGSVLSVSGQNGSGKTTLLRLLAGLMEPEEGEIEWRNQNIRLCKSEYHTQIAYIGHSNAIRLGLTPLENLSLFVHLRLPSKNFKSEAALRFFGLTSHQNVLCKSLSIGQKRKVALARLVHSEEPLWILDEPFAGLDGDSIHLLRQLMEQQVAKGGMVVLSTHHPVELKGEMVRLSLGCSFL